MKGIIVLDALMFHYTVLIDNPRVDVEYQYSGSTYVISMTPFSQNNNTTIFQFTLGGIKTTIQK